jgi:hypothetical protein
MGQQLTGVHVFEKLGPIEWEDELIAIQVISALTWKKHHGRIELYCNEEHLESLKKWGADKIYDKIDTSLIDDIPKNVDKSTCWSFCKIYVSSKLEPPFVMVDTDLWLSDELEFDTTKSFVAYHEENYDWSQPYNFYVNFDNFVPEKYINQFDLNINPTNVALLFWNDKDLLQSWYEIVYEILLENRKCELTSTQKTTFLEQWLLPMNTVKLGKDYGVLIPQKFNSFVIDDIFHPELWSPPISGWNETHYYNFNRVKHVWGLKKSFGYGNIVNEIFGILNNTTKELDLKKIGLSDILDLIEERSGMILPSKKFSDNKIKVMLFIPDIITNNETNFLIKRIEYIYKSNFEIEFFVINFHSSEKNNPLLINKIINIIGSRNYFKIDKDINSILKIINENRIDICQYDLSFHDKNFNSLMFKLYENINIKTIKSDNGVDLISNINHNFKIDYPLVNNVLEYIPNVDYEFSKNELPLHEKIKRRILYSLDYTHKHIICFVDDILNIPHSLFKIIDSFKYNNNVEFHFLNYLNNELDENKKIILRLPQYTKMWLENIDYIDFILLSDLVLDFTTNYNSISIESLTYGIPTLKRNQKITGSEFEVSLPNNTDLMIAEVKNNLFNKKKSEILISGNNFSNQYHYFYSLLKISNN